MASRGCHQGAKKLTPIGGSYKQVSEEDDGQLMGWSAADLWKL